MAETPKEAIKRQNLSDRERDFILAYTRIGSASYGQSTKSALASGYTEKLAELTGSRLLKLPRVLNAISAIHQKLFDEFTASPARVMSDLENAKAMALDAKDRTSYIRLVELMGKSLCIWSDKTTPITTPQAKELDKNQMIEARVFSEIRLQYGDEIRAEIKRRILKENNNE